MLLEIRNLHVGFRSDNGLVPAVRGVDLQLEKGKVLGLVGESGCGKSVTSLAVMGLLPQPNGQVTAGEILFNGQDLLTFDDEAMRALRGNEISMIFQEPMTALNPVFRIGEQIGEVLEEHQQLPLKTSDNRRRVIELLQLVRIPRAEKLVDEYPHQLSGGMRQRVMIAMALACNPRLLIADEPTTALDVTIQAQVLGLMRQLKAELDTAVLFITHDLGVISEMADAIAVMYAGQIVEQAATHTLLHHPRHPYTSGLIKSRPATLERGEPLYCIPGMVPSGSQMPPGCAFAPRCAHATPACNLPGDIPLREVGEGHLARCLLPPTATPQPMPTTERGVEQ